MSGVTFKFPVYVFGSVLASSVNSLVHAGVFTSPRWSPTLTQSAELLTDAWRRARTQTYRSCVFLPSIRWAAQLQLSQNRALSGLGTSRHRATFSQGFHKHARAPKRTSPCGTVGTMETGTDHKAQFLGIPVTRNHTRSLTDTRRAARTEVLAFMGGLQGALWLTGEEQGDHSCQMFWMNANKFVRMLQTAFFRMERFGKKKEQFDGESDKECEGCADMHVSVCAQFGGPSVAPSS